MPAKKRDGFDRFRQDQPAAGLPARNKGGISEPTRAPQQRVVEPSPNSKTKASALPSKKPLPPPPGSVPNKPVPRSRQDSIDRPITSPSTTGAIPGDEAVATEEIGVLTTGAGTAIVPGQEETGSGLAQGEPGTGVPLNEAGMPMSAQEQQEQLTAENQQRLGDTSGFLSSMEAQKQQEDLRKRQPSPVEGVPQGTYEQVVKDPEIKGLKTPISEEVKAAWRADAETQLRDFGSYPGRDDPNAPKPPIRPMGRSFNPFTGKFTGEKGPNAFQLMGIDMEKFKQEFFRTGGGRVR